MASVLPLWLFPEGLREAEGPNVHDWLLAISKMVRVAGSSVEAIVEAVGEIGMWYLSSW